MSIGAELFLRTASLLGAFILASAVLARVGAPSLGAHQIAFQLFIFLALVLDAIAIAGQVIVGRALGAGDVDGAVAAARRMIELSVAFGLLVGGVLLALRDCSRARSPTIPPSSSARTTLWPLFALMQPIAAVVFALDGILIGAGDARYLAASMVVAWPSSCRSRCRAETVRGVWVALDLLMVVRLVTLAVRFAAALGARGRDRLVERVQRPAAGGRAGACRPRSPRCLAHHLDARPALGVALDERPRRASVSVRSSISSIASS